MMHPLEHNPYEAVRMKHNEEVRKDGSRQENTLGYDAKDRLTYKSSTIYNPDGSRQSSFCMAVEADGYWRGGVSGGVTSDGQYLPGCSCAPEKFEE